MDNIEDDQTIKKYNSLRRALRKYIETGEPKPDSKSSFHAQLEKAIKWGFDVNYLPPKKNDILLWEAILADGNIESEKRKLEIIKLLLDSGANPNIEYADMNALYIAINKLGTTESEIIELLADRIDNINKVFRQEGYNSYPPTFHNVLSLACSKLYHCMNSPSTIRQTHRLKNSLANKLKEIIKVLIRHGADIDMQGTSWEKNIGVQYPNAPRISEIKKFLTSYAESLEEAQSKNMPASFDYEI